jgi:hypothetical protein
MFLSIALSRVVPVIGPVVREWLGILDGVEEGVGEGVGMYRDVMERFGALVKAADRECKFLILWPLCLVG